MTFSRDDLSANTKGFSNRVCKLGRFGLDDLPVQFVRPSSVVFDTVDDFADILVKSHLVWFA